VAQRFLMAVAAVALAVAVAPAVARAVLVCWLLTSEGWVQPRGVRTQNSR
jgi:hypothetical protein